MQTITTLAMYAGIAVMALMIIGLFISIYQNLKEV